MAIACAVIAGLSSIKFLIGTLSITCLCCDTGQTRQGTWRGCHLLCCAYRVGVTCPVIGAVTLTASRLQPMLVLMQALLCHSWLAYQAMHTSSPYSRMHTRDVSAAGRICCNCCSDDTEHQQLASPHQQEQVRHHQHCQQADSKEQQMQQPVHHSLQVNCQPARHLCDYQMHVQQQQQHHPQCLAQHGQKQLLCSKQADHALAPAVLRPYSLQQPKLLQAQGRHHVAKCAIFIKLVVCCILLRALPFTAWLKQSRHSWQPAGWTDALPDAVLGAHAALLVFLVSCVKVRFCTFDSLCLFLHVHSCT